LPFNHRRDIDLGSHQRGVDDLVSFLAATNSKERMNVSCTNQPAGLYKISGHIRGRDWIMEPH
jgi:hypothetical protein